MREISFEEVENIWKKNLYPYMLYIHHPFCKKVCNYCAYRGRIPDVDTFDTYFNTYLPNQIKKYSNILKNQHPQILYFGGGTPTYNIHCEEGTLEHYSRVFPLIKSNYREAAIEVHTGFKNTRKLFESIKANAFTTVILCVQDVCLKPNNLYNRYCCDDPTPLEDQIKWCKELDLMVGIDLLYFPNNPEMTFKSLEEISKFQYQPDEITIAQIYQEKTNQSVSSFKDFLKNNKYLNSLNCDIPFNHKGIDQLLMSSRVIRYFTDEGSKKQREGLFYSFVYFLDEGESPLFAESSNLGIGSYKNTDKWTYSSINKQYTIIEKCEDVHSEPKYYLTRERSFYDKARNFLDWMEKTTGRNAPFGLKLTLVNDGVGEILSDSFTNAHEPAMTFDVNFSNDCFSSDVYYRDWSYIRSLNKYFEGKNKSEEISKIFKGEF